MNNLRNICLAISVIAIYSLAGCTKNRNELSEFSGSFPFALRSIQSFSGETDRFGNASITVPVPSGTKSFQAVIRANTDRATIRFNSLKSPAGKIIATPHSFSSHTGTPIDGTEILVLNYPYGAEEPGPISEGNYTFSFTVIGKRKRGVRSGYTAEIVTSEYIAQSQTYILPINVILSGATAGNRKTRLAIEDALGDVQAMYRSRSIELAISIIERPDLPSILPSPAKGDILYEDLARQYPFAINLVFGVDVRGLSEPHDEFSIVGSTPLPAVPTPKSAVAFSIIDLAGSDGEFDSDRLDKSDSIGDQRFDRETQQMATVIAHGIGHGAGLTDTVTIISSKVIASDPYLDTQSCTKRRGDCTAERGANENIMFPFTLKRKESGKSFLVREKLSPSQRLVIVNYLLAQPLI